MERSGAFHVFVVVASMKVPPKRKGNAQQNLTGDDIRWASMKVPPKRKGNSRTMPRILRLASLNESPSEKEGKSPKN